MKRLLLILLWLVTTPALFCQSSGILPQTFGGWQKSVSQKSSDPAKADGASPALLKEFGFTDMESATYAQSERKMTVKAARFGDFRNRIPQDFGIDDTNMSNIDE